MWHQLVKDVAHVCILREHLHKVAIAVAQKSFSQGGHAPPAQIEHDHEDAGPRIRRDQVQLFAASPVESSWTSRRFAIENMEQTVEWFASLLDSSEPIRMMSWFQLNALFEHQTATTISYKPSCKRYFLHRSKQAADFVKRTNSFSRWVQGVFACKVLHVRPNSSCLKFWTMCIPIQLKEVLFETSEQLLLQHQPMFAQVKDLRYI